MHKKSLFKLSLSIIFTAGLWLMPQSALAAGSATFTETAPLSIEAYNDIQYDGVWDETPYLFRIEVTNAEESKHNGTYALEEIPDFRGEPSQYIFRKVKDDGGLEINDRIFVDMDDIETAKVRFDEISLGGWGNSEEDVPLETNETFTEFNELISSINDYQYRWAISSIGDIGSDTYVHIEERVPGRDNKFSSISFDFWYTFCDEVEGYDSERRLYHNGECRTSTLEDATTMIVIDIKSGGSYASATRYNVVDGERGQDREVIDIYFPQAAQGLQEQTDQYEADIGESSAAQQTSEDDASTEDEEQECEAGSLGWIVCALSDFLFGIVEFVQKEVIVPFLTISPLDASEDDPVFAIWKSIRVLANSLLGLFFLIIIFAQVMSMNIDAYAIRKILPRLLIVTIAIQISFYIVAYLVDITALIGNGIGDLVITPLKDMPRFSVNEGAGTNAFLSVLSTFGLGAIAVGAIYAAGGVIVGTFFIVMLSLLPVIFMVFFTLVFRQILIMLLAIVSPIAFALWVLPNTEGLFKKWWSLLIKALFMYPLIILLFAGGAIVASIASSMTFGGGLEAPQGAISTVIAMGAIIAPLAMIPMTFKFAGSAISGFASMVQNQTKRLAVGEEGDGGIAGAVKPSIDKRKQRFASGTDTGIASKMGLGGIAGLAARPGANKFSAKSKAAALTGFNKASSEVAKELEEGGFKFDGTTMKGIIDPNSVDKDKLNAGQKAMINKYKGNPAAKAAALAHLADSGQASMSDFENVHGALSGNPALQQNVIGGAASAMSKTNIEFAPYKFPTVPLNPESSEYKSKFTEVLTNAGAEDWSKQKQVTDGAQKHMRSILSAKSKSEMKNLGVDVADDEAVQTFKRQQKKLMQNIYMYANTSSIGATKQASFDNILTEYEDEYHDVIQQAQEQMRNQGMGGGPSPGGQPSQPQGGGGPGGSSPGGTASGGSDGVAGSSSGGGIVTAEDARHDGGDYPGR